MAELQPNLARIVSGLLPDQIHDCAETLTDRANLLHVYAVGLEHGFANNGRAPTYQEPQAAAPHSLPAPAPKRGRPRKSMSQT